MTSNRRRPRHRSVKQANGLVYSLPIRSAGKPSDSNPWEAREYD